MKTASKVFIIIGLVCSIIVLVCGLIILGTANAVAETGMAVNGSVGTTYIWYGIYALVTSIGSLCAVNRMTKRGVIIWGIFYIPVMLIASIFMFCIPPHQLNQSTKN